MTKNEQFHLDLLQGIDAGRIYAAILDNTNAPKLFTDTNAPQHVLQYSLTADEVSMLICQPVKSVPVQ